MGLVDDAIVASPVAVDDALVTSPVAIDVAGLCIGELSGQLASTRAEVILLTSKLYDIQVVRNKAKLEL